MLAAALTAAGFPARRGQQFAGGTDSPDVICPTLTKWHWEAKLVEQCRIKDWLTQVTEDSQGKPWIIAWKRRRGPWLAIVSLDSLLDTFRDAPSPQTVLAPPCASGDANSAAEPSPKHIDTTPNATNCNEPQRTVP